ncbi:formate dehydrogenase accessory protein FdhE [Bartonella florencae]|uniref:formate dehydrogenase accessory protein FdhE n=1 Tax=Bartonella florencae TaxID=928210 RepID=UPI0002E455E4|nr:formate dehydrogenase accessory protein FdhE [Bartonella florencae]
MSTPIFIILPNRETLFAKRAQRFAHLANSLKNKQSLLFFAHFCHAQQQSSEKFKDFAVPLCRFAAPTTAPLNRLKLLTLGFYETIVDDFLQRLSTPTFSQATPLAISDQALKRTHQQKDQWRIWGENLLNQKFPPQQLAEHIFITGALQIIYCLAASQLDAQSLTAQQNNLCPACNGTHSATLIIEAKPQETIKVCSCLYCGALWQIAYNQCSFCQAKQSISTHSSENISHGIFFERCEKCGSYCKQFNYQQNPTLDVFADDISSTIVDFLPKTSYHFKHKSFNPFLAEYSQEPSWTK